MCIICLLLALLDDLFDVDMDYSPEEMSEQEPQYVEVQNKDGKWEKWELPN